MRFLIATTKLVVPRTFGARSMSSGSGPAGDGKAGAIREAGGAFGKLEIAREEEYFYKKQQDQLKKLKSDQITQLEFLEKQVKEHEEALQRNKELLAKLKK